MPAARRTVATATGQTASSVNVSGVIKLSTGTAADLAITGTGNALSVLGLTGATGTDTNFTAARTAGAGGINGKTLTFTSFNGGTAVDVTFGDGTGGYGQDPRSAQCQAAGQQPDRDHRLRRQADDLGNQRLRLLDPRHGRFRRRHWRHHHLDAELLHPLGSGRRRCGAGRPRQPGASSTTTSWPRSPPRPRTLRSTASTCSRAISSS